MKNLLSAPGPAQREALNLAVRAAREAFPLSSKHEADLPYAVRDLSRLLTSERGELRRSYWSTPRFLSAYVRFFLPWNLFRLSWLLPGLPFTPGCAGPLLDLGSGPLTLPLALWCSRPDLRDAPLEFVCTDVADKPMEVGKAIFERLARGRSPWRLRLERCHAEAALGRAPRGLQAVLAGNVLNELAAGRQTPLEDRLAGLVGQIRAKLAPGAAALFVEPGTRLGGKIISMTRRLALEDGLSVLAPCTHAAACPMLAGPQQGRSGPQFSGWCHFIHPAQAAPAELALLSRRARLEKESLALSCLLLEQPRNARPSGAPAAQGSVPGGLDELEALYAELMAEDAETDAPTGRRGLSGVEDAPSTSAPLLCQGAQLPARVVSGRIRLPEEQEAARYVCSAEGLGLLLDAATIPSGGGVEVAAAAGNRRDPKTGALVVRRAGVSRGARMRRDARPAAPQRSDNVPSPGHSHRASGAPRAKEAHQTGVDEGSRSRRACGPHQAQADEATRSRPAGHGPRPKRSRTTPRK